MSCLARNSVVLEKETAGKANPFEYAYIIFPSNTIFVAYYVSETICFYVAAIRWYMV